MIRAEVLPQRFPLLVDIVRKNEIIYLGALISNKCGSEADIKRRIRLAKWALTKLTKIWKGHQIKKDTRNG